MTPAADFGGWTIWLTVIACGVVTLCARASFIVLPKGSETPRWMQRGLKFVVAAVLPALIVPEVLYRDLAPGDSINVYRVIAMSVALVVAYRTRHVLHTLGAGLFVLWFLQWWAPL